MNEQAIATRPSEVAQPVQLTSLLNVIADAARDPNCDAVKLRELVELQQQIVKWQAQRDYDEAYAAMWAELPQIARYGTVNTGKGSYTFARMEDLDAAIRPILAKYGFALQFRTVSQDVSEVHVIGALKRGGHAVESEWRMPPDVGPGRNALQAIGSASQYAKRYISEDLLNLVRCGVDDDGVGATKPREAERRPPPPPRPPQPARDMASADSWIGKTQRALEQRLSKPGEWLSVLIAAYQRAPAIADVDALEDWTRDGMASAPPVHQTSVSVARAEARKRLAAPPAFEAQIITSDGEVLPDVYREPRRYAEALVAAVEALPLPDSFAFLDVNRETMERAKRDPEAARILHQVEAPPPPRKDLMAEPDEVWVTQTIDTLADIRSKPIEEAAIAFDTFAATDNVQNTMRRLKKDKPALFDRADAVFKDLWDFTHPPAEDDEG